MLTCLDLLCVLHCLTLNVAPSIARPQCSSGQLWNERVFIDLWRDMRTVAAWALLDCTKDITFKHGEIEVRASLLFFSPHNGFWLCVLLLGYLGNRLPCVYPSFPDQVDATATGISRRITGKTKFTGRFLGFVERTCSQFVVEPLPDQTVLQGAPGAGAVC